MRWRASVRRGGKSRAQQRNDAGVRDWVLAREKTRYSVDLAGADDTASLQSLFQTGKEKRSVLAFQ